MAGNPNFGNILSTTIDNYSSKMADNYVNHSKLLKYLKSENRIKYEDGGANILEQVEFDGNGSFDWYKGTQTFNLANKKAFTAAVYGRKYAYSTITVVGDEVITNAGKEKMIDLIEAKIENGQRSLSNGLASALYSDGTNANQIGGLQYLVSDNPTVGTVGGIDRSDADNAFWRNKVISLALTKENVVKTFDEMMQMTTRNSDTAKAIFADNKIRNKYYLSLEASQRFTSNTGHGGFVGELQFNGITIYNDQAMNGFCPAGHAYFINPDFLKFRPNKQRNPEVRKSIYSINQDCYTTALLWAGNLTMSGGGFQGVVIDTSK